MKDNIRFFSVFIVLAAFSACTVNVNQPNANENTSAANTQISPATETVETKARWSVVVCSSRAKNVTFSAGPNQNDSEVFAIWKDGAGQKKFDLPSRVQNLSTIYFMAGASDKNQVELCVLYDGKPKKRVEFDDSEDQVINATDSDDNDCRCTE